MYIRYFIPEDGDDEAHPNVFKVLQDSGVTLADIKQSFPIAGTYHFRFLRSLESFTVWMDVVADTAVVPVHQNCITIKASRITSSGGNGNGSSSTAAPQPRPAPAPSAAPKPQPKPEQKRPSVKLINFDDDSSPTPAPAPAANSKYLWYIYIYIYIYVFMYVYMYVCSNM
jgi:hypothetical protein